MPIPYKTRSGLQIGIRYQQPKPLVYPDDELIQRAYIGNGFAMRTPRLWVIVTLTVIAFTLVSCLFKR